MESIEYQMFTCDMSLFSVFSKKANEKESAVMANHGIEGSFLGMEANNPGKMDTPEDGEEISAKATPDIPEQPSKRIGSDLM